MPVDGRGERERAGVTARPLYSFQEASHVVRSGNARQILVKYIAMKRYGALATFAYVILAAASVWFGGLNQDEGWYLYAANLVREGKMLYRDFFYTQGPLLPLAYAPFAAAWRDFGLIGGRIVTAVIGLASMLFAAALARLLAAEGRKGVAGVVAFLLVGCNIYHIYYLSIPKTYAIASLFTMAGFFLYYFALLRAGARRAIFLLSSGLCFAMASGARVSLGAMLVVCGLYLLVTMRSNRWGWAWFGVGGAIGLATLYGPYVALPGFQQAIQYHLARGGFDPMFTVGSLSRLVRWYYPIFILLGLALCPVPKALKSPRAPRSRDAQSRAPGASLFVLPLAFLVVFLVQIAAPYPYEDYQVPIMALLAVFAAVRLADMPHVMLLALGLSWSASFGSPLLEKWTIAGQDRLWAIKREKSELEQLQEMACIIEAEDPGGKELLTQDIYLAIETNRKVPRGLEMGPFSILSDSQWRALLSSAPCEVAALSGYSFAIEPPACNERDLKQQISYWSILENNYQIVLREDNFGQNSTPLVVLKRKKEAEL